MIILQETRSRSEHVPLTEADLDPLVYTLKIAAIGFGEPLTIETELGTVTAGRGFGALSHTLWSRGDGCTMCGNCCKRPYRRIWYWMPSQEQFPEGLPKLEAVINGKSLVFPYSIQSGSRETVKQCNYLEPAYEVDAHTFPKEVDSSGLTLGVPVRMVEENGYEMSGCSLWRDPPEQDLRPSHCIASPFLAIHNVRNRDTLSKRLPSRNWRWPKCPIDIYKTVPTERSYWNDYRGLKVIADSFGQIPGSYFDRVFDFWEKTMWCAMNNEPENVPTETLDVEEILRREGVQV